MATFIKSVLIDAPVERVFAFHERPDALELLTPPFPPVRILYKSGGIHVGARVVLRVGFTKWVALHTAYEKDRLFIDQQVEGPFKSWVHRHEFAAVEGKTRLTDHVEFEFPGLSWAVKPGLVHMFRYRHRVTRRYCETK
jgi:ligand-binding SRPBCC domain-containing protein